MNLLSGSVIFLGAGLGALLRWALSHLLNPLFPALPPGTLAANVVGALLMGIVMGVFAQYEAISPTLRLAVTTGFLGGLTTFSAFSAESTALLLRSEYRWAFVHTTLHVGAALLATLGGMVLIRMLLQKLEGSA